MFFKVWNSKMFTYMAYSTVKCLSLGVPLPGCHWRTFLRFTEKKFTLTGLGTVAHTDKGLKEQNNKQRTIWITPLNRAPQYVWQVDFLPCHGGWTATNNHLQFQILQKVCVNRREFRWAVRVYDQILWLLHNHLLSASHRRPHARALQSQSLNYKVRLCESTIKCACNH